MKKTVTKDQLMQKLVKAGKLDAAKLEEVTAAAKKSRKTVFEIVVEREFMSDVEMMHFLSDELSIPFMNLASFHVPPALIKAIPKKIIDRYQILPVGKVGKTLTIVGSNPFEIISHDELRGITGCNVVMILSTSKVIASGIENYYGESSNLEEILEGIDDDELEVIKDQKKSDDDAPGTARNAADEAPVIRMVNLILSEAIKQRASDIHFEPYEKDFRVRYRIDGALKESYAHSRELYGSIVARMKIMALLDITEKRLPQDGRFRVRVHDKEIDFRVSMLPIYHGEKVVLRVLDRASMRTGLGGLGLSDKPTAVFSEAVKKPYGMILVTGPTGSGKSTTLYSILNSLNSPDRNIMTIEDPVEYQVEGITQTQVQAEVGLTFASGLRCLLRQSPDVILVGEMRDTETADIGVKAALTGHLVFSTLHTNSAAGAMKRLTDMGVEPFLIASSVICVAAQRLVKKICQFCKEPTEIKADVLRRCGLKPEDMEGITPQRGKGCAKCNQSGYFGRQAVIEVLKVDPEIQDLILKRASSDLVHNKAVENGMEALFENAFGVFKKGLTTIDEVMRVTTKD